MDYNTLDPFQCTWWAKGRASQYMELKGIKIGTSKGYPRSGHGGAYYNDNKTGGWFAYGSEPKANSIVSWTQGEYGHVAYVEAVDSTGIWISHANFGKAWEGIWKIERDGGLDKRYIDGKWKNTGWKGYDLNGYIYLDTPLK